MDYEGVLLIIENRDLYDEVRLKEQAAIFHEEFAKDKGEPLPEKPDP